MVKSLLLMLISILSVFSIFELVGTSSDVTTNQSKHTRPIIVEELNPDLTIREGYVSQTEETVKIVRNGKMVAEVRLGEPIVVAQAEKEEKWGYFQFPGIARTNDDKLIVGWHMSEDSHKSYGKDVPGNMMSSDGGKTWKPLDKEYFTTGSGKLRLQNGNFLQVLTPTSKEVRDYSSFPEPVYYDASMKMNYYLESQLPDDLQGMYLCLRDGEGKKIRSFQGGLEDPGLLRYDIGGLMPVKWWGDMAELSDGALIAGIYPSCYQNPDNETLKSDITFYRSNDGGYHWKAIGRIPFQIEKLKDKNRKYDRYQGFSEATFQILKDSIFFCVMRSGYNTPMYRSFSYDKGYHWTEPEAFTSNGVRPRLLQLNNGIIVMASGRPGIQLRFCLNGDGKTWTEPIEMLPYMDEKGEYDMWDVSCGYPQLLQKENNSFYVVYSDFKTKNEYGELRKSIIFREISILGQR